MKKIEYQCDLCGDILGKDRRFVAFELGLMGDHHKAEDRFYVGDPAAVERHLCHCCLAGLVALARRALPAAPLNIEPKPGSWKAG
jgi:hypothetical protein